MKHPTTTQLASSLLTLALALVMAGCAASGPYNLPNPMDPTRPTAQPLKPDEAVLIGAGDISSCENSNDEITARLLDHIEGTIFTLGDNVYPNGSESEFRDCYEPTWGRHKSRTRPAPGNHDYNTQDASPYFSYFGEKAGSPGKGYYSYTLAGWQILVLNSNCEGVGCGPDSEQTLWLRKELQEHPSLCTLAYWHHPRFSAGKYENNSATALWWDILYEAGAEVVLSGHDHNYQRYAPQDPQGNTDPKRGIRQFIVGTGGRSLYEVKSGAPNREVANSSTYGLLKLTLRPTDYSWEFVPVESQKFADSGSGSCR